MATAYIASSIQVTRRPIYPILAFIPAACFAGGLLTDITYWRTTEIMWANFSAWLISAGVILGIVAAIIGIIELIAGRFRDFTASSLWLYAIANLVGLVLAVFNMLIHTRDAWTSVVPWGMALSAATVIVLVAAYLIAWPALSRREVEMTDVEMIEP